MRHFENRVGRLSLMHRLVKKGMNEKCKGRIYTIFYEKMTQIPRMISLKGSVTTVCKFWKGSDWFNGKGDSEQEFLRSCKNRTSVLV